MPTATSETDNGLDGSDSRTSSDFRLKPHTCPRGQRAGSSAWSSKGSMPKLVNSDTFATLVGRSCHQCRSSPSRDSAACNAVGSKSGMPSSAFLRSSEINHSSIEMVFATPTFVPSIEVFKRSGDSSFLPTRQNGHSPVSS